MNEFFYIFIVFAAFGGFLIAFYINHKKQANEVLVCPLNSNCEAVVHSEYSHFFGMPVEVLGMAYYALVAISYGVLIGVPSLINSNLSFTLLSITTAAFAFSIYLVSIQTFALRQWCTWCLFSAGASSLIFFSSLVGSDLSFLSNIAQYTNIFEMVHLLSMAVGLGGVTISSIFFFRFLRDFKIAEWEADVLRGISQVVWLALFFVVISLLGLLFANQASIGDDSAFFVLVIITGVLMVSGAFLSFYVSPRLLTITFGGKHVHEAGELRRLRRIAFFLGVLTLISWYTAFIFSIIPFGAVFTTLIIWYGVILLAGVAISQVVEHWYTASARQ